MSDSNLTVASGAIGLAKSLIDFVPASQNLINVSCETYNWLIRERIDERSFECCRKMALGLAYPNEAGMDIQRQIKEADQKIVERVKQLPIRLILSGSIGRLLAKDVDTCYMVSTVAALTKFHEREFATEVLCSMIFDKGGHEEDVSYKYNVQRAPVKAVMYKIVDSIYLNVVNAGHDLGGLPAELEHLHPHLLDDVTFAGIVMGIERSEHNVVIRCDRFISDLTLWLLLHFHGRISVSVKETVVYEKTLGPRSRIVRIMVKNLCLDDRNYCEIEGAPVEASISVGDKLFTFLTGTDDIRDYPNYHTRQALYDVENLANGTQSVEVLNQTECKSLVDVAKTIMTWLLSIPVVPATDDYGLTFRALLVEEDEEEESSMSIGDLLQNHPRLHSLGMGLCPEPDPISRRPDEKLSKAFLYNQAFTHDSFEGYTSVLDYFPMAKVLLDQVEARCSCSGCESKVELRLCKRGCLRQATVTRVLVLVAHCICDAFGVKDVSGRDSSRDQVVVCLERLFSDILHLKVVRWNTWFELVACFTTGIPLNTFDHTEFEDKSISWAAVQYGSLLVVASWLDITEEAKVKGCFGITTVEGNLQGVVDDIGLVRCERDKNKARLGPLGPCENGANRMQIETAGEVSKNSSLEAAYQLDTLEVELYTAVFHKRERLYQLMTTVRSGKNLRIVDPGEVIMILARSRSIQCTHDPASAIESSGDAIDVCDFDRILAEWSGSRQPWTDAIQMSKVLDSQLKINTVLNTQEHAGCLIRVTNSCCFSCAIEKLQDRPEWVQRCIINISTNHSALGQIRGRKRQMES